MGFLLAMESAVAQGVLWGIMAIGVYITYRIMSISDLTVDGTFALGACVSVAAILKGIDPILSIVIALVAGAIAGSITGILHTRLKIPAILSGILTMISLYSVNIHILGRGNVSIMKDATVFTKGVDLLGLSRDRVALLIGLLVSVIMIIFLYWFFGTEIGCAIRATGNNESMAKAQGVNTDSMKILGLAVSNAMVALSGALVGQSQRFADVTMGTGTIVIGLASVVIGGIFFARRGNFASKISFTVVGSVVYRGIIAAILFLGLPTDDQKIMTAVLVVIALMISDGATKLAGKKKKGEVL